MVWNTIVIHGPFCRNSAKLRKTRPNNLPLASPTAISCACACMKISDSSSRTSPEHPATRPHTLSHTRGCLFHHCRLEQHRATPTNSQTSTNSINKEKITKHLPTRFWWIDACGITGGLWGSHDSNTGRGACGACGTGGGSGAGATPNCATAALLAILTNDGRWMHSG